MPISPACGDASYNVVVVGVCSLDISSTPTGATIYIGNNPNNPASVPYGTTNKTGGGAIVGVPITNGTSIDIKLTHAGYADFTITEPVSNGGALTKNYTMTALTGSLNISSTPEVNALIYIDGTLQVGVPTPAIISGLSPGDHTYQLTKAGYTSTAVTHFNIDAGGTTTVSPAMLTVADIRASSLVISQSNPCIQGSCVVTVTAKWTNYGQTTGSFTPSITVAGTHTVDETYGSQNLAGGVESGPIVFTVRGLTAGTHSICPILNT